MKESNLAKAIDHAAQQREKVFHSLAANAYIVEPWTNGNAEFNTLLK